MAWKIDLGFYKGKTSNLVITDTFPNKGLVFKEDSLDIKHKVGTTETTLVKGTDYTLLPNVDYGKGFIITFTGEYEDSEIFISYLTSFDPNDSLFESNDTEFYKNLANIKGDNIYNGAPQPSIDVDKEAEHKIRDEAFNNGKKVGTLNRDAREISWEIYTNYMAKNLTGSAFVVTDTLGQGQTLVTPPSIEVREYTINNTGTISSPGALVASSEYTLVATSGGFTLTFPAGISKPYVVLFKSKIEGISKNEYTNSATVTGGKDLSAKVPYPKHNDFLLKKPTNVDKDSTDKYVVWLDNQIDWEIVINTSLSNITKGAIIEDKISKGLVYVDNSLKIVKQDDTELPASQYVLVTSSDGDGSKLTITFNEGIDEKYTVKYSTVVVSKTGEINNSASFKGTDVVGTTSGGVVANVRQSSSGGSGSWDPGKGSIVINKTNTSGASITAQAEFKIYYDLNGIEKLVGDQTYKTVNGQIKLYDLSFRTYYIKEVTPPNGFEFNLTTSPIVVVVNTPAGADNSGAYTFNIKNTNIKIDVTATKTWVNGPDARPSINLQLYRNGTPLGGPETVVSGQAGHTWTSLNKTDNAGLDYLYTVKEVGTPVNYTKSEVGLTVTNTYVIPKTSVTATKEWKGGPLVKPSIQLQLYKDGIAIESPVTIDDPTTSHTWTGLDETDINGKAHVYTVDEVNVPYHYVKQISGDGLTVTNIYSPPSSSFDPEGRIKITKKDKETNEVLSGAEFSILNSKGEKVYTLITDNKGQATSKWLPIGDYSLEEVKAPKGYKLDTKLGSLKIKDKETLEIDIYNEKDPEDPEDPEEPIDPEDPKGPTDPDKPGKPGDPSKPKDPNGFEDYDEGLAEGGTDVKKPGGILPKTGSVSTSLGLMIGILVLLSGLVLRIKKTSKKV